MTPSTPSDSMVSDKEHQLRKTVLEGLGHAANDVLIGQGGVDRRSLTKTEEEKLLYFAIEEFDLSITYSWYLAGSKAYSSAGTSNVPPDTSAHDTDGFQTGSEYRRQQKDLELDDDVERFREFFRETVFFDEYDLNEVILTDGTEFLCDFYNEYSESRYAELYQYSTRFRDELRDITETVEDQHESSSLGEFGGGTDTGLVSGEQENEVRRLISKIHFELAGLDELENTLPLVTKGTDQIELILAKLTNTPTLSDEQVETISELQDFFYYYVWKYPALKISAETATGPAENRLKKQRERKFREFNNPLQRKIDWIADKRIQAGLRPSVKELSGDIAPDTLVSIHEHTFDELERNDE